MTIFIVKEQYINVIIVLDLISPISYHDKVILE